MGNINVRTKRHTQALDDENRHLEMELQKLIQKTQAQSSKKQILQEEKLLSKEKKGKK